jgi:hypothetical protein
MLEIKQRGRGGSHVTFLKIIDELLRDEISKAIFVCLNHFDIYYPLDIVTNLYHYSVYIMSSHLS